MEDFAKGFVAHLAEKTGVSQSTLFRDLRIAVGLTKDSSDRLRGSPIATQTTTLEGLSALSAEKQKEAVDIYTRRKATKGEAQAEKALKIALKPPAPPEPPLIVRKFDEPMPIDGGPLETSLLGSIVRFQVVGGCLHAEVLGPDLSLAGYRWPLDAQGAPTTTGNWMAALHHARTTMMEAAQAAIEIGPVEVVPPTYCPTCGESVFWVQRRFLQDKYLAEGRDPPFGWKIEGPSGAPKLTPSDIARRQVEHDTVRVSVDRDGKVWEYRLLPRRGWPMVVTTGACARCSPSAEPSLARDLAASRHQVIVTVKGTGPAALAIRATVWPSARAAGVGFDPTQKGAVIVFEIEGEQWDVFEMKGGGDAVFSSLAALDLIARLLFEDVYRRATDATVKLC